MCIGSKHTVVTTVAPEITRLSPRNGFNGFLRALLGDEFLFVTVALRIDGDLTRLGRFRLRKAWHQQRMPGPHDFAVRSDLNQSFQRTMCCPSSFGGGVEAPFVRAPVLRSQARPALRLHLRANAAASTASHPAFVTTAKRPSCRERTGRAGRTDLPDGESEIFFAKGLDRFLSRRLICPSGAGVGWAKALLRRAHHPTLCSRWWARGACHRARVRATRWLCPPYKFSATMHRCTAAYGGCAIPRSQNFAAKVSRTASGSAG